jgi:hypothetical protein
MATLTVRWGRKITVLGEAKKAGLPPDSDRMLSDGGVLFDDFESTEQISLLILAFNSKLKRVHNE